MLLCVVLWINPITHWCYQRSSTHLVLSLVLFFLIGSLISIEGLSLPFLQKLFGVLFPSSCSWHILSSIYLHRVFHDLVMSPYLTLFLFLSPATVALCYVLDLISPLLTQDATFAIYCLQLPFFLDSNLISSGFVCLLLVLWNFIFTFFSMYVLCVHV